MPRASTQNARPALRRLPTRASRIVQDVVSWVLPLLDLRQLDLHN